MNTVRQALLELINLQKQRISQLEVQNRHQATELCKWQDTCGYYSPARAEIGDTIQIHKEKWKLLSRSRAEQTITLERLDEET